MIGSAFALISVPGTVAAPTATLNTYVLGTINFTGNRDTTPTLAAQAIIRGVATENWSATANGTKLSFFATNNGVTATTERVYVQDALVSLVPVRLFGYTVATLPAGTVGDTAYVTNALAPAFGAAVVGGGAVTIPVFFDGANWIVG